MKKISILRNQWFWLIIIVLAGVFLRLWQIGPTQHLSYDQSRDYIIIKRMIVDRKLTLVGPTVSIAPGFFLPPFYYYSLIPFLWLSRFHIIGPDIYTAFFGIFSIILFYFLAKDLFGVFPALIAAFSFSLNPYLIQASKHAWNPNTLYFYTILFFLSFERYCLRRERKYLLFASFSLGWAIGLHLTAIVFLPMLLYLFFLEIKKRSVDLITVGGIFLFFIIFIPLLVFDFKHGFPIIKAGASFSQRQSVKGEIFKKSEQLLIDVYKMPVILLSGLYQKENLTVRPSNITSFSNVNFNLTKDLIGKVKILLAFGIWMTALLLAILSKEKFSKPLLIFFGFGLLIRFCFPEKLFYFYYYLSVFPLIYLFLGFLLKKFNKSCSLRIISSFLVIGLNFLSFWPNGIYADPKPESYFLPTCGIIANDFSSKDKIALAGNVSDRSRWEHNSLEYHYFLEAIYKIPIVNWEAADYKSANVLYFIDEGEVKEPLKFGGMEVEAFQPKKIVKVWTALTGQKIYKMTR